jgi:hypothetical protein
MSAIRAVPSGPFSFFQADGPYVLATGSRLAERELSAKFIGLHRLPGRPGLAPPGCFKVGTAVSPMAETGAGGNSPAVASPSRFDHAVALRPPILYEMFTSTLPEFMGYLRCW